MISACNWWDNQIYVGERTVWLGGGATGEMFLLSIKKDIISEPANPVPEILIGEPTISLVG